MNNDLREQLAALEHEQWAHWTAYMLKVLGLAQHPEVLLRMIRVDERDGPFREPESVSQARTMYQPVFTREQVETILRWRNQIATPYAELSEKEKDSDREWADKALLLVVNSDE
jgi:hypothetical protein